MCPDNNIQVEFRFGRARRQVESCSGRPPCPSTVAANHILAESAAQYDTAWHKYMTQQVVRNDLMRASHHASAAPATPKYRSAWHAYVASCRGMPLRQISDLWRAMPEADRVALLSDVALPQKKPKKDKETCEIPGMPEEATPLGIGGPDYPVTQHTAEGVSQQVRSLHTQWCETMGQPVAEPVGGPDEDSSPVPAQCCELYGHGVCRTLLSAAEINYHQLITRQLCRLSTLDECEGPGKLKFLELLWLEPQLDGGSRRHDFVLMMIAKYKTPQFPIFLQCSAPAVLDLGAEVTLLLAAPVHSRIFTAPMLSMRFLREIPRGTSLKISRCSYTWVRLDIVRVESVRLAVAPVRTTDPVMNLFKDQTSAKRKRCDDDLVLALLGQKQRPAAPRKQRKSRDDPEVKI